MLPTSDHIDYLNQMLVWELSGTHLNETHSYLVCITHMYPDMHMPLINYTSISAPLMPLILKPNFLETACAGQCMNMAQAAQLTRSKLSQHMQKVGDTVQQWYMYRYNQPKTKQHPEHPHLYTLTTRTIRGLNNSQLRPGAHVHCALSFSGMLHIKC